MRSRTNNERRWATSFRERRDSGQSLWQSAGCALSPILAAAIEPIAVMWPMDEQRRAATETALVRLAAMTGATPPAQGGGWNWSRESSVIGQTANSMLDHWFTLGHALAAALAPQP
ncbi:MAG TPA: hypothetical protein VGS97_27830 [Actinocrinis sp.]|uniref:hypothetical protein n=1 Tax=Actinocrinis sp. TaxID=1920516 RepID=UPI002DDD7523|nr:hypothetical protein [Actinocrinis sp.]HEV2347929.1 hypothetical protein [Actinocrinis sp.]